MKVGIIAGKTLEEWIREYPSLKTIISGNELFWHNPHYSRFESAQRGIELSEKQITDAQERLQRFAPYLSKVFPETRDTQGLIESRLIRIPAMQRKLAETFGEAISGSLWLKCDSHLAVSGSIKARGGIYEVLKYAEDLAIRHGRLVINEDYSIFDSDDFKEFFSGFSIAVGSTGNLGLSIGIIGAQLGFKVVVHMSSDAKQWKKDLLRRKGVTVVEHASDYSNAVKEGRRQARLIPKMHFIDDERSVDLFLGYAVAALRLETQLKQLNITIDDTHPLFVYLPCGVGGAAGGVTFGLKQRYKDNVHCFFAEPTASPCMLLGLMTQLHEWINVRDFGLDNITAADGLAVATPSGFVGRKLQQMISGVYTIQDNTLYKMLRMLYDAEKISLEPSALAGMPGAFKLFHTDGGKSYLKRQALHQHLSNAVHIVWATGGSMVPAEVMQADYEKGTALK